MSTDNWWDSISSYESDYIPGSYKPTSAVEANHNLLKGLREDEFDNTNSTYNNGLLTLALVFLISGVVSCFLLPFLYDKLVKKAIKERLEEGLKFGSRSYVEGNLLMVLVSIAAMACASGAIWGLQRTDVAMTELEKGTQGISSDVVAVLSLPNDTADALEGVSTSFDALLDGFGSCTNSVLVDTVLGSSSDYMESLVNDLQGEVEQLNREILNQLANEVQGATDSIDTTEGIRNGLVWPVISLSMLIVAIFFMIAIGTYECVPWGVKDYGCFSRCVSPFTIFLAAVIWLSTAAVIALSALSGDFCIDPDSSAQTFLVENQDEDETFAELVMYYTGDCTADNTVVDLITTSQELAKPFIGTILVAAYATVSVCDHMSSFAEELDQTLLNMWTILEDAAELTSCENLNGQYQSVVYDEFCDKLPRGLLGFWVSCIILTAFLLMLAALWAKMLWQKRADNQGGVMEAREDLSLSRDLNSLRWPGQKAKGPEDPVSGIRPVESASL